MSQFQTAPLSALRVGAVLSSPIYDPRDAQTKLLGAGVAITPELLSRLNSRSVSEVVLNGSDLAKLSAFKSQGAAKEAPLDHDYVRALLESEEIDDRIEGGDELEVQNEQPFLEDFTQPVGAFDGRAFEELAHQNESNVQSAATILDKLKQANSTSPLELSGICENSLEAAAADLDLLACLGASPFSSDYPFRHSVHVASLAVAVATRMGLGPNALKELALGCLAHDLGMLKVPQRICNSNRRLTTQEVAEVANHPVRTAGMLGGHLASLPLSTIAVTYQTHERCDGTGYPRGKTAAQIHPHAKIAAVADTFVGLAANRPHRTGLQPYFIMKKLLAGVTDGLFDPDVIRALLQTVSLFPLGSFVRLSDDRRARVIRPNGSAYDRPIVELFDAGNPTQDVVDLLQEPNVRVVQPLSGPK